MTPKVTPDQIANETDFPPASFREKILFALLILSILWWMYALYGEINQFTFMQSMTTTGVGREVADHLYALGYRPIARFIGGLVGASLLPLIAILFLWRPLAKARKQKLADWKRLR